MTQPTSANLRDVEIDDLQTQVDALLAEIEATRNAVDERLAPDDDDNDTLAPDALVTDLGASRKTSPAESPHDDAPAAAPEPDDATAPESATDPALDAEVDALVDQATADAQDPPPEDSQPEPEPDPVPEPADAAPEPAEAPDEAPDPEPEPVDAAEPAAEQPPAPAANPAPKSEKPQTIEDLDEALASEAEEAASQSSDQLLDDDTPIVELPSTPAPPPSKPEPEPAAEPAVAPTEIESKSRKPRVAAVGLFALELLAAPLRRVSPTIRDTVGWIGLNSLFIAACLWIYLLLR